MISVGYMNFVNMYPIYWHLENDKKFNFIKGVPSKLNKDLSSGQLDVSPVSSLEYMNRPERYRILPDICISTEGAVHSVLLCSKYPIQELCGRNIYLTTDSLTSANLVKLVLERFMNSDPKYVLDKDEFDAVLLIGDKALHVYHNDRPYYTYDLGDIWYKFTGYPFVFSLWLTAAKNLNSSKILELSGRLKELAGTVHNNLDEYANDYIKNVSDKFTKEQLIEYWGLLNYNFGEKQKEGLVHYYKMLGYEPKWYFME